MIISVTELRQYITTTETDSALQFMLEGLESLIVQYTHNGFVNRSTGLIDYPMAIKTLVVDIVEWKLRQKNLHGDDKPIQSETISRHSVTYASDSTELDIDTRTGLPKKFTAVLDLYKKARF